MDQALSRAEAKELMGLLGLPEDSWGNVPLITYRFRQKSKIYHPDKGGNEETMKRMTELYSRMQNTLQNLRSSNENENMYPPVRMLLLTDTFTLGELLGPQFESKVIFIWPTCAKCRYRTYCKCVCCILKRQHDEIKKVRNKPCVTWGECYCFDCFLLWFGCDLTKTSLHAWKQVMYNLDLDLLMFKQLNLVSFFF